MVDLHWLAQLDDATTAQVRALLSAVSKHDGRPELPQNGGLPGEFHGGAHLLAGEPEGGATEVIAGYAHLDLNGNAFGRLVGELIVAPARRREGIGSAMMEALIARGGTAQTRPVLRLWSHGDHPGAAKIAEHFGFNRVRELLLLKRSRSARISESAMPPGIHVRRFVPGRDEEAVVEVNSRAFAWHPEQGQMTSKELVETQREKWFDPQGFFLAEDREGRLLGFHWTKVHPANPMRFEGKPVGEVYVLGVDPDAQGSGLGKALTLLGLEYLEKQGLENIILYVESDNASALKLYRKFGFDLFETDVQYELDR